MGKDEVLPKIFTRLNQKYQTPYISIIACACIISILILNPLADLFIMDICLYTAGIVLEFVALISLRRKAADHERPFRIPLKKKWTCISFSLTCNCIFLLRLQALYSDLKNNRHAALAAISL